MMVRRSKIVADGRRRASEASLEQIRAEVEAEYAEELKAAGRWKRFWLRRRMDQEIRDRARTTAPPDGLYLRS